MAAIPTFWKIGALVPALLVAGIGSWHARADPQELPRLTLAHGPSPAGPRAGVPRLPTRPLSLAPPPSAVRLLRRAAPPSARATNPSGGAVTTAAASSASEEIAAHEDLVRREVDERLRRGREGEKRGDIAEALTEFQWAREMISWSFHEDTSMAGPLATAEAGFERNRAAMGVIDEFLRTAGELFAGGYYERVQERCREFLATHPRYEIITRCGELARAAGQASSDGDNSRHWITSWCLESSPADQDLLLRFGLAEESKPDDGERISPRSPIGLARPESRSAADLGALNRMRATRISLAFTKAPLTEVVAFLREFTSLNMLIDPRSLPTLSDIRVTLTVEELPFESVLSLMLKMHHLSYHVADGIIVVTAERESGNGLTVAEEREDMTCFLPDASSSDPGLLPGAARTRGPGSLTFNVRDLPLTCMAAYLTEQTGVAIRIDAESVPNPGALRVTLCAERLALTAVLDQLCAPLGLCAVPEANGILVRQAPER